MVSSKVRSRINELKEKANSWEETEVNVFDPKDALLDSDYNDMIGMFDVSNSGAMQNVLRFYFEL